MANTPFKGNAGFKWTDWDTTPRTYTLRRPLDRVMYAARAQAYPVDSLDFVNRQVYRLGTGVYEIVCDLRYDEDNQTLVDLVRFGQQGGTINHYKDLAGALSNACLLIEPVAPIVTLALEHDYPSVGSMITVRLRRTDGGAFTL